MEGFGLVLVVVDQYVGDCVYEVLDVKVEVVDFEVFFF